MFFNYSYVFNRNGIVSLEKHRIVSMDFNNIILQRVYSIWDHCSCRLKTVVSLNIYTLYLTVEFQLLEHLWDHANLF